MIDWIGFGWVGEEEGEQWGNYKTTGELTAVHVYIAKGRERGEVTEETGGARIPRQDLFCS